MKEIAIVNELDRIKAEIAEGNISAAEAYLKSQEIEKAFKAFKADIQEQALEEIEAHGGKEVEIHGFLVTKVNGRKSYKFDHIEGYKEAKEAVKEIEDKAKEAANLNAKNIMAVAEGGELLEAAQVTYAKDSLRVTKIKK